MKDSNSISFYWRKSGTKQWNSIPLADMAGHTVEEVLLMMSGDATHQCAVRLLIDGATFALCSDKETRSAMERKGYLSCDLNDKAIARVPEHMRQWTMIDVMPEQMLMDVMAVFPQAEIQTIGG